ncbi:hypothetical protein B7463_g9724, partial [Scytalidium lignicola]
RGQFVHYKKPLLQGDDDFIFNKEDLITLRPGRESAWLHATVEKILKLFPRPAINLCFVPREFIINNANANTSNAICMGILLVATLLFSAALALFTKAKRHELLGAAAAYCALLVVFIANLGLTNTS